MHASVPVSFWPYISFALFCWQRPVASGWYWFGVKEKYCCLCISVACPFQSPFEILGTRSFFCRYSRGTWLIPLEFLRESPETHSSKQHIWMMHDPLWDSTPSTMWFFFKRPWIIILFGIPRLLSVCLSVRPQAQATPHSEWNQNDEQKRNCKDIYSLHPQQTLQ